jgi:hypothetical protein
MAVPRVTGSWRATIATGALVAAIAAGCTAPGSGPDPRPVQSTVPSVSTRSAPLTADLRDGEKLILEGQIDGSPIEVPEVESSSFAVYVRCEGEGQLSIVYEGRDSPFKAACDGMPTRVEIHLESAGTSLSIDGAHGTSGQFVVARI